jgi:hypothetical protein
LSESRRGQWGEGLTAAEMGKCRWLGPQLIATIDYLERTAAKHLRLGVRITEWPDIDMRALGANLPSQRKCFDVLFKAVVIVTRLSA